MSTRRRQRRRCTQNRGGRSDNALLSLSRVIPGWDGETKNPQSQLIIKVPEIFYTNRRRRRAAGVKIAGAGLTMLYFRSRVLYMDEMGKQKSPKPAPYQSPRNILHEPPGGGSVAAAPRIAGAGLTMLYFRSRVLYLDDGGVTNIF